MKISDETKVGILAAFGIAILIIGYSFLKGNNLFVKKQRFYAIYKKVDGLNISDPLTLNGYRVGRVADLSLMPDNSGHLIATFMMDEDIPIPKDSRAELYSSDLLGEKAVRLLRGKSDQLVQDGDTIAGDVTASLQETVEAQIMPVKQKAEDLLGSIDSVIDVVKTILLGGQIESSMENIERATNEFKTVAINIDDLVRDQKENIGNAITNIESITANLDQNSEEINAIISNVATITDSLSKADFAKATNNLNTSLTQVSELLDKINNSEGSLGLLVNDKELYENLVEASANLESLLADLEENPKRYVHFSVFGGGDKKRKKKDEEEDVSGTEE